jgi:hypothetical protein
MVSEEENLLNRAKILAELPENMLLEKLRCTGIQKKKSSKIK